MEDQHDRKSPPLRPASVGESSNPDESLNSPHNSSLVFQIGDRVLILSKDHFHRNAQLLAVSAPGGYPADGVLTTLGQVRDFKDLLNSLCIIPQTPIEPTRDSMYYLDTVTFEVEDRLFMVPKHQFLESTIFDSSGEVNGDGPIKLEGVSKVDFQALLQFLYPLHPDPELSIDQWVSVLKLTTKWKMLSLRDMAIKNMPPTLVSPIKRILLGRELHIVIWLYSGYSELTTREEPLSVEDFKSLGLTTALKLSQQARRQYKSSKTDESTLYESGTPESRDPPITQAISEVFEDELHDQSANLSMVERIILARSYGASDWLRAAYTDLAKRREDITVEEAERLGLEATIRLCRVRERLWTRFVNSSSNIPGVIEKIFWMELRMVEKEGVPYRCSPRESSTNAAARALPSTPPLGVNVDNRGRGNRGRPGRFPPGPRGRGTPFATTS